VTDRIRRKYRGALRVVELQAEVERLLAAVPKERGAIFSNDPEKRKQEQAWHDAHLLVHQALRELWGVSPARAHDVAKRLGLGDPAPDSIRLSPFDKLRHRRRGFEKNGVPCGKRITGYQAYLKRYCKRPDGHDGWCSESRF
jgi:hypothetical protein